MSKILLIKPRFLTDFEFRHITQPLGLMYIGATLKKAGHEPRIHDCAVEDFDESIRLNSKYADPGNNRGIAYLLQGEKTRMSRFQKTRSLGNCKLLELVQSKGDRR